MLCLELAFEVSDGFFQGVDGSVFQGLVAGNGLGDFRVLVRGKDFGRYNQSMLVFVDESGDVGLKFTEGSCTYFVVTLVLFENDTEAEKLRLRIDLLRTELRLPGSYEFHFFRNNVPIRRAFLNAIKGYDFQFFSLVVDKRKLSSGSYGSGSAFYKAICGVAFDAVKHLLSEANVKFDDSGGQAWKKELASYIKRKVNDEGRTGERIKKIGTQNSKSSTLIQVADMVSGAVYRSFSSEADAHEYRNIIKHREYSVLQWP